MLLSRVVLLPPRSAPCLSPPAALRSVIGAQCACRPWSCIRPPRASAPAERQRPAEPFARRATPRSADGRHAEMLRQAALCERGGNVRCHATQPNMAPILAPPDAGALPQPSSRDERRHGEGEEGVGSDKWWDAECLFHPIVLPPSQAAAEAAKAGETAAAAAAATAAAQPPLELDDLLAGGVESYWRMYYYGRSSNTWGDPSPSSSSSSSSSSSAPLPPLPALFTTGSIGLAVSRDGMAWRRVRGPEAGGAVLTPRWLDPAAFDSLHVGCGDVVWVDAEDLGEERRAGGEGEERQGGIEGEGGKGEWWMFYFGGGREAREVRPGVSVHGAAMRIGVATSQDGIHFHRVTPTSARGGDRPAENSKGADQSAAREGVVLEVGVQGGRDDLFVAWPRVLTPSMLRRAMPSDASEKVWLMTYSAMSSSSPSCILLASSPDGLSWTRLGPILFPGAPGAWDAAGVGRRHVTVHGGMLAMWYEGVGGDGRHAIGLATSHDGFSWSKAEMEGCDPGGPVFGPCDTGEERREGKQEEEQDEEEESESEGGESVGMRGDGNGGEVQVWEDLVVAAPHVVSMGNGSMRLYYAARGTASKGSSDFRIGVAFGRSSELGRWSRRGEECSSSSGRHSQGGAVVGKGGGD